MESQIPVQNVYYMLVYAWKKFKAAEKVSIQGMDQLTLLELLSEVLCQGLAHLHKQGLDRSYRLHEEAVPGIKGRLHISPTLQRNLMTRGYTHCEFDVFDEDVLHNQLLKSSLKQLLRSPLTTEIRAKVMRAYHRMNGISLIPIHRKLFSQVRLGRHHSNYGFLLNVCELILQQLLPDEAHGRYSFQSISRDHQYMARLFEQFLKNFFKRHLDTSWVVASKRIAWNEASSVTDSRLSRLPGMMTDIVLSHPSRTLIIDAKYYHKAYQERFGTQTFKSPNLYQLYTYLRNWTGAIQAEGMLIYPQVGRSIYDEYVLDGYRVVIATINMNQSHQEIERDLLDLVENGGPTKEVI